MASLCGADDAGSGDCLAGSGYRTEVGAFLRPHPGDAELHRDSARQQPHSSPDVRYMRPLLKLEARGDCRWHLDLRDAAGRVLQTFRCVDFDSADELYADRLETTSLIADLTNADDTVRLAIPRLIVMPKNVSADDVFYSVQDPDRLGWKPLYSHDGLTFNERRLGDNVGFVMVPWAQRVGLCSGIALPPDLFLTNWHCGLMVRPTHDGGVVELPQFNWNTLMEGETLVDLSWDDDRRSREFKLSAQIAQDEALDYALFRMKPLTSSTSIRPIGIRRARLDAGASVRLIHHPAGRRKMASMDCSVREAALQSWRHDLPGVRFSHDCDTEGGSSGAPVFDQEGRLVGLHHHGFDLDTASCKPRDRVNKAIWIDAILDDLAMKASAAQEASDRAATEAALAELQAMVID